MNTEEAARIVAAVFANLEDRSGIGDMLEQIADERPDVYREMLNDCTVDVLKVANGSTP